MEVTTGGENRACAAIEELLVWFPTSTLTPDERRQVQNHVAECQSCADLLSFAENLKGRLSDASAAHPAPEALVRFVEQPEDLPAADRTLLEAHLARCPDCRQESEILLAVERDIAPLERTTVERPERVSGRANAVDRLRSVWEALAGTLLRPVPAAVYLTATAALALVLMTGLDNPARRGPVEPDIRTLLGRPGLVDGVILLPSDKGGLRGAPERQTVLPSMQVTRDQFLLLELTEIEQPPETGVPYSVTVSKVGADSPSWTGRVEGQAFGDNYTVCVLLEAGTLEPGRYVVTLASPAGGILFRSTMEAH